MNRKEKEAQTKNKKKFQNPEDEQIVRMSKNQKLKLRREKVKEEDDFDTIFKGYKSKIMAQIEKEDQEEKKSGKKKNKNEFEEIVMMSD